MKKGGWRKALIFICLILVLVPGCSGSLPDIIGTEEEIPEEEGSVEADEESLEEESLSEDGEYVQEALPDDDTEMLLPEVEEAEEEAETDGEGPVTLTVNLAWVDYYEDTVHNDVTMILEKRVGNRWVDEGRKLILNDKNEWQSSLIVDGNPKDFRFVEEDDDLGGGEVFAGAFRDLLRMAGEDA